VALAATITGTFRSEVLVGTQGPDAIEGRGGHDRIAGLAGADAVHAGWGRDRVFGGAGGDEVSGGVGRDRLIGGSGDDVQAGGPHGDLIKANLGVDRTSGGHGRDRLFALARGDVRPGPNGELDTVGDSLDGGPGNDRIRTRDGEVDTVTCGPGRRDRARLDLVDVIADATTANPNGSCEFVRRAEPKPEDAAEEPDTDHETSDDGDG
jgi:Ca2+-binding RTX toxin-like protein